MSAEPRLGSSMFQLGLDMARPGVEAAFRAAPSGEDYLFDCVVSIVDAPTLAIAFRDVQGTPVAPVSETLELFPLYESGGGPAPKEIFEAVVEWLASLWTENVGPVRKGFVRGFDDPPLGPTLSEAKRCWALHEGAWARDPRWDP